MVPDREKVISGLNDISGFIAGRVGFEQARNFLHTIDEAVTLLEEQLETDVPAITIDRYALSHKEVERMMKAAVEELNEIRKELGYETTEGTETGEHIIVRDTLCNFQMPEKCKHCGYYYNFMCRAKQCIKDGDEI